MRVEAQGHTAGPSPEAVAHDPRHMRRAGPELRDLLEEVHGQAKKNERRRELVHGQLGCDGGVA